MAEMPFDPVCQRCPRLVALRSRVRSAHPDYHAAPVPPFGDPKGRLLIVGLAPGMHGANASGRPFTGDHAGILLFRTLYEMGLSNRPEVSGAEDGLVLQGCRITNAVKCLPPENRPTTAEIRQCNGYLAAELAALPERPLVLALGTVAHQAVLRARGLTLSAHPFAHGRVHELPGGFTLVDCYHCSRYNTQTGRLTPEMFRAVFAQLVRRLQRG
ncbi:uracil-DNA glycosylase, family 4 [Ectothiorhodospira mobilis]|uniref:Type-5 uracil-DNA glycosylase n=2 Tax=Ectothiorhodospira mobilis TaxID=195064 RepID=A0A1I4PPY2_ECTMO|nr:uracil-DNA glycosylase, family 4 [Ectothiorhodospira mobilis]